MCIGFWHDKQEHWKDGLWAALELLKAEHEVLDNEIGEVNLVWTSSINPLLDKVPKNSIWLYAGGPILDRGFKTVVEDRWTQREFKKLGVDTSIAFGVNTSIFKPMDLKKKYEVIFPAAFAKWKRHELLIEWVSHFRIQRRRPKVLVVGHKQNVETECYKICEKVGFEVRDLVSPEELALLYNQSHECWIPSELMGGSQRTLLEALACGIPTRVAEDNPRLQELLSESVKSHHYYKECLSTIITIK